MGIKFLKMFNQIRKFTSKPIMLATFSLLLSQNINSAASKQLFGNHSEGAESTETISAPDSTTLLPQIETENVLDLKQKVEQLDFMDIFGETFEGLSTNEVQELIDGIPELQNLFLNPNTDLGRIEEDVRGSDKTTENQNSEDQDTYIP